MDLRRALFGTLALAGLQLAAATPAAAMELPTVGLSIESKFQLGRQFKPAAVSCASFIQPAAGLVTPGPVAAASAQLTQSKSAAILGGQLSKLELIARQQGQAAPSTGSAAQGQLAALSGGIAGAGLEPAAGPSRCANLAAAALIPQVVNPAGVPRSPLGSGDFLASKRLSISRTSFDGAWNRVESGSLSRKFVNSISDHTSGAVTRERILAINAWTNDNVRYVEDKDLYGRPDYWANARMTLQRRAGDCEDIAIAKMQLLAAMGVSRDDMYLTIARDLARNADHALLVVRFEDRFLLLDNATNQVLDAANSYDYRPIMTFSAAGKWLHGY